MWALFVNRIRTVAGRGQGMQLRRVFHEMVEHLETLRHRSGIAYSQPHACTGAITCHYDKSFNQRQQPCYCSLQMPSSQNDVGR